MGAHGAIKGNKMRIVGGDNAEGFHAKQRTHEKKTLLLSDIQGINAVVACVSVKILSRRDLRPIAILIRIPSVHKVANKYARKWNKSQEPLELAENKLFDFLHTFKQSRVICDASGKKIDREK